MHRLKQDGVPLVGFTWYSLQDQVDWDTALRENNGRVNPLGLCDLDRQHPPGRPRLQEADRAVARHAADREQRAADLPLTPVPRFRYGTALPPGGGSHECGALFRLATWNEDGQEAGGAWSAEALTKPSTPLFSVATVSVSTATFVAWAEAHIHFSPARWTTKDTIVVRGSTTGAAPGANFSSEIVRRAWTTAYLRREQLDLRVAGDDGRGDRFALDPSRVPLAERRAVVQRLPVNADEFGIFIEQDREGGGIAHVPRACEQRRNVFRRCLCGGGDVLARPSAVNSTKSAPYWCRISAAVMRRLRRFASTMITYRPLRTAWTYCVRCLNSSRSRVRINVR